MTYVGAPEAHLSNRSVRYSGKDGTSAARPPNDCTQVTEKDGSGGIRLRQALRRPPNNPDH